MKKTSIHLFVFCIAFILLSSCVAKKKFLDSQIALRYSKNDSARLASQVNALQFDTVQLKQELRELNDKIAQLNSDIANKQNNLSTISSQLRTAEKTGTVTGIVRIAEEKIE